MEPKRGRRGPEPRDYRPVFEERVLPFLRANFRRDPPLPEIAAVAGLSPFHFHRAFTRAFGKTPRQVILDMRVDEAKQLLAEGKLPLEQIAEALGFSSHSHFTSVFRAAVGTPPLRYRRDNQVDLAIAPKAGDAGPIPQSHRVPTRR